MRHHPPAARILLMLGLAAARPAAAAGDVIFYDEFEDSAVPLLWHRFEGNATSSGFVGGYGFALTNAAYGTGKFGQGLVLGVSGFASVAGMRNVLVYPQVTIAFWTNIPAPLPIQAFWSDINRTTAPYGGVQIGENSGNITFCASTTTNSLLTGTCNGFASPSHGAWHHWIIRYAGTGIGAGQGGAVEVYLDNVLALTKPNDASNNPVFNDGMPDTLFLGGDNTTIDELKIYNRVFTPAQQCTLVIGGTWNGASCTLP